MDEFKEKQTLSFLSQTEWLKWVISKWGHSDEEEKKGTPDMHNTPVHLWDKEYGFPLTVVREAGAPDGTGVDDDDDDYFDFTTQYDDEERGDTGSTASPNNRNSNATPNNRNSNRKQKQHGFKASRDNLQMLSVMKTQSAIATKEREKHFSDIKELAREVFKSTGDEQGDKIDMQAKLQQTIATTKAQLKEAEKELKTLKRKRRDTKEMVGCSPSNHQLKKKLKSLDKKAMSAAIEVSTFEKAFGSQLKQLRKLSGGTGETDDAEDDIDLSEISDDSESDSDA